MSDQARESQKRGESLLAQAWELRERVSQLQMDVAPRGVAAARKTADAAEAAAVAALRFASEAHARAAEAHRQFAALLERTGRHEQAQWHWAAAAADEEAATRDLRQMHGREAPPGPEA